MIQAVAAAAADTNLKRIPSLPIVERPDAECEETYPRPVASVKETSHSKHRTALEAFSAGLPDDIGRLNKVSPPWLRPLQRIEPVDEPRARTEAQGQLFDASRGINSQTRTPAAPGARYHSTNRSNDSFRRIGNRLG